MPATAAPPAAAPPAADHARAARRFHALSDPTRLALLERLRAGEHCVCDLQDLLGAAQSRLSFHLRVLKDAGLVTDRRAGRWAYYAVVPEALDAVQDAVAALRPVGRAPHVPPPETPCRTPPAPTPPPTSPPPSARSTARPPCA